MATPYDSHQAIFGVFSYITRKSIKMKSLIKWNGD